MVGSRTAVCRCAAEDIPAIRVGRDVCPGRECAVHGAGHDHDPIAGKPRNGDAVGPVAGVDAALHGLSFDIEDLHGGAGAGGDGERCAVFKRKAHKANIIAGVDRHSRANDLHVVVRRVARGGRRVHCGRFRRVPHDVCPVLLHAPVDVLEREKAQFVDDGVGRNLGWRERTVVEADGIVVSLQGVRIFSIEIIRPCKPACAVIGGIPTQSRPLVELGLHRPIKCESITIATGIAGESPHVIMITGMRALVCAFKAIIEIDMAILQIVAISRSPSEEANQTAAA